MDADSRPSKMIAHRQTTTPHYHIRTHGGLGDVLWCVGKKLANVDLPIFITVSSENRTRPYRVGRMLDHIPCVIGWTYDDQTFAPGGQDWTTPNDPSCAIDVTWRELKFRPNSLVPYPLECNRWLEGGRRIDDWLPDLKTTHRVPFLEPGPSRLPLRSPSVVLHIAGWPDVPDRTWTDAACAFMGVAHVYIIGGSYDHRPRRIYESVGRANHVTLVEDAPWEDLWFVLNKCAYCFGHASGLTAIADAIGLKGAVFNPKSVPGLIGTWNDPTNRDMVHVDRVADFEESIYAGYAVLGSKPAATWPPAALRGATISAPSSSPSQVVRAASRIAMPREALVVFDEDPGDRDTAAAVLTGCYDVGALPQGVTLLGHVTTDDLDRLYAESARSSRRAVVDVAPSREVVAGRNVTYDLIVLVLGPRDRDLIPWAWSRLSRKGTLLVRAQDCNRKVTDSFRGIRVAPADIDGAPDWVYIHRRL